jgi:H+/Cl- antiporter ClcA
MKRGPRYSPVELNARLRFFVGIVLAAVLSFTVCAMLYGLLFVYQGDQLTAVDAEFFKLLSPVVMFLTGTLSGVMIASGGKPDRNGDGIPDDQEVPHGQETQDRADPDSA